MVGIEDLSRFKQVYFEEAAEHLEMIEESLLAAQEGRITIDDLHAIFRAVHSIKGGAGCLRGSESAERGERLVKFAHSFETFLDILREGKIEISPDVINLMISGTDCLSDFVKAAQADQDLEADYGNSILERLEEAIKEHGSGDKSETKGTPCSPEKTKEKNPEDDVLKIYKIHFKTHPTLFSTGNDPLLIIRELKRLGPTQVMADINEIPPIDMLKTDECHLHWKIALESSCSKNQVKEAFEFVDLDCDLEIEETPLETSPKEEKNKESKNSSSAKSEEKGAQKQAGAVSKPAEVGVSSIRVDLDRVDKLVNTVGEIVIKQAMFAEQINNLPEEAVLRLEKMFQELTQHTRDLQESVMSIRAQPVKSVFSRMPRLVRDLSAELGKQISFQTVGEETEIDKTVIERLGDPLTHMIRNAVDHGIEMPEERKKQNKDPQGTIILSAAHRSGRIIIELKDDGKGIDRKRVLAKAREKGIIEPDEVLADEDIDNLIFAPGFSTAEKITNISGRGVGMDVVKKSIQGLGGRIDVQSNFGKGSRFILSLPLTLAALDGMLVQVSDQCYVLPLISIIETLRPRPDQITHLINESDILQIRNEQIRLVYLSRVFGLKTTLDDLSKGLVVVVETEGGMKVGLVVDELLGQQQVVLKTLEANYDPILGISAATILGNGHVALILDINALKNMNQKPSNKKVNHEKNFSLEGGEQDESTIDSA